MKAIALQPGTTNLRLAEYPEPSITKETEVKVKVLQVGICGTDREEASGGRADAPPGEKELIIGHEMLSKVLEVGKKVTKVKPGDLAVITVRRGCNACDACKIDRSDLCTTGNYTERGIKSRDGFHAEYVVDEEKYVLKVPAEIADIGVLSEPMAVVQKAIDVAMLVQTSRLPFHKTKENWLQGQTVLVAGLGPIGILAALVFRLRGATVIGLDRTPDSPRIKLLQAIGGTYIDDGKLDMASFQKQHPNISLILEAAGVAKLDFDLLDCLGINGAFVLTGVPGKQRLLEVDGASIMKKLVLKNQVLIGSVNESIAHFEQGIADLEAANRKWPGIVQKFITQKFSYADYQKALEQHSSDDIKVVIEWSKP